jgi:hypothetical protein
MSQNDFNIANQGFPATRADINSALQALASTSAGATAPSTTYAYQFWYDSTANLLKMRNAGNDAWITLAAFDQAADEWEVRTAVVQAVDSAGISFKTDDGTARIVINDDGTITGAGAVVMNNNTFIQTKNTGGTVGDLIGRNGTDELVVGDPDFANPLIIKTGNNFTSFENNGSERVRITSGGFLGLGTTSPDYFMELEGNGAGDTVTLALTNLGSHPVRLRLNSGHGNWSVGNSLTAADNLEFRDESAGATRMQINSSGAVSIGGILTAGATESKVGNGYVVLPSGIYIQWGVNSASTGGSTHNFPITFPNAARTLVGVNNNQANPPAPQCQINSTSQFTLTVSAGSPAVNWIAIGH